MHWIDSLHWVSSYVEVGAAEVVVGVVVVAGTGEISRVLVTVVGVPEGLMVGSYVESPGTVVPYVKVGAVVASVQLFSPCFLKRLHSVT